MVPYKFTVELPSLAKGTKVQIYGLGEFPNGETTMVSDEEAEVFRALNATITTDDSGVNHSQLAPKLTEVEFQEGITVEEVSPPKQEAPKTPAAEKTPAAAQAPTTEEGGDS
jgi:hypothetical protein